MDDKILGGRNIERHRKMWVAVTSSVVLIFAIALAAFSIYVLLDLGDVYEIIPSINYRNGAYLVTFSGIFLAVVCFLALSAVVDSNRCLLILTTGLYIIVIILLIIAAILIFTFNGNMGDSAKKMMEDSLVNSYNKTSLISRAWDLTQTRLRCCAVSDNGWQLYKSSYWSITTNKNEYFQAAMTETNPFFVLVPDSCCYIVIDGITGWPTATFLDLCMCKHFQFGPPRFMDGAHNPAVYYRGCFNAIKSYISHFSGWLGGLSLISILPLLWALVTVIRLLNSLSEKKND